MNAINNNEIEVTTKLAIEHYASMGEAVISKRLEDAVNALEMTDGISFNTAAAERKLSKGTPDYKSFRETFNRATNLRTQMCVVGMEVSRGSYSLNYGNPHKNKARTVGGVRENSLLFRALEVIRAKRIRAFLKSHEEKLLPSDVELTDKQWTAICLSQYLVPGRYRIDSGNGPRFTQESAENYLADFVNEIHAKDTVMAENRNEMDKELNAVGANIHTAPVPNSTMPSGKKTKNKAA
jgi:hypothetical protein